MKTNFEPAISSNLAIFAKRYEIDLTELLEAIEVEIISSPTSSQDLDDQYTTSEVKAVADELGVSASVVLNAIEQHQYYRDLSNLRSGTWS